MDGKVPTPTVSSNSKASSSTIEPIGGEWQINKYGTYFMKEKGTLVCGSTPIIARTTGPFTTCLAAYNFQPGGWCNYDEVML